MPHDTLRLRMTHYGKWKMNLGCSGKQWNSAFNQVYKTYASNSAASPWKADWSIVRRRQARAMVKYPPTRMQSHKNEPLQKGRGILRLKHNDKTALLTNPMLCESSFLQNADAWSLLPQIHCEVNNTEDFLATIAQWTRDKLRLHVCRAMHCTTPLSLIFCIRRSAGTCDVTVGARMSLDWALR